jgi:hypothetical protein
MSSRVHAKQLAARNLPALGPGLVAVVLMLLWAIHDGGYDADTWYWGALVLLAASAAVAVVRGPRLRLSRPAALALAAFAAYVAWSYLSISWAESPGDALSGSNRALLYLLAFGLMLMLPWTVEAALVSLVVFVLGVGVIAIVLLTRLASADHVARLVIEGRLASPTGYFNSTAALFTIATLLATALAARRELPGPLRGALFVTAAASVQLALIVQSRGWLFTLPLMLLASIVVVRGRLRVVAAALVPALAALIPLHRLLDVYQSATGPALIHAAQRAGQAALVVCGAVFVLGTLLAWVDGLWRREPLSAVRRRQIGAVAATITLAAAVGGGIAATHGHPWRFVKRQWNGFSHTEKASTNGSHFSDVGSGRYDYWRVSLDALLAHPIGGLGQDNFADYYVTHRRTTEEPSWTHSFELRLLAHTGLVGFALFAGFLAAALVAVRRGLRRRGSELACATAAAATLPLVVWLIYGSVDWFWEVPALSGPALGFLGLSIALGERAAVTADARAAARVPFALPPAVPVALGAVAVVVATVALGFPYLAVRELSTATNLETKNPASALRDLLTAARLNPLSSAPAALAGTIALQHGQLLEAERRYRQAIDRQPRGWFAWLGDGLAASELGDTLGARRDYIQAAAINPRERVIAKALADVLTPQPLTPAQAFGMLSII